jgi:hypothetical protein
VNERIKELIKQAGDYVNEVYTPPVRSKTPGKIWEDGHIGWHTQFNQKFTELIVRECMDVCYRTDTEYEGHKVKSTVIASKVAEHFGVEE